MNILTSKLRIAVAALAVMALPALAAAAPARPVKTAKRIAGSVDSNDNGRLSDREWDAARRERLVKRFLDLDTNRSGTVSRSEARRASAARVLEYDGVISRGEMIHSEHLIWGMEGTQKFVKKYTK
jgi:hypothetical protein